MTIDPFDPDYDYLMNLWAGQIYLSRAVEGTRKMLEGLR